MSDLVELIKKTINLIESTFSTEIIIYDLYNTLYNTQLGELPQINRWHLNNYCLYIKESEQIYHKCKTLKQKFFKKHSLANGITKATCFCGVSEYISPIKVDGNCIALISITGFRGDLKEKLIERQAYRLGVSVPKLLKIREKELVSTENEKDIITFLEILAHLFDEFIKENEKLFENNPTTNQYILKAIEYIDQNFTKNISVSDVAKECYVSIPYLQSVFSKYMGHGVAEEIRNRQINYAKELLSTTEHSVKYIAFQCGYDSPDYFSVVFKRECSTSPLKYRKEFRNRSVKTRN